MTWAPGAEQAQPPARDGGPGLSAAAARLARLVELTRLLQTTARVSAEKHDAAYLLVDRTGDPESAEVKALLPGDRLVDLWELDPLLWDDANWAAVRLLEAGEARVVRPGAA